MMMMMVMNVHAIDLSPRCVCPFVGACWTWYVTVTVESIRREPHAA